MHSTIPPDTSFPLRPRHLLMLAVCNLLLSTGVATLSAVIQVSSDRLGGPLGANGGLYIQMAAAILWVHAMLAAVVPTVLAEGQRAFRCVLVAVHVVAVWVIQTIGYAAFLPFSSEMLAELASTTLVASLGMVAGVAGALLLLAVLWGWTLTRWGGDARHPTFSVRGMLLATASAAALFASPRVIVPLVNPVAELIHEYWREEPVWSGTTVSVESNPMNTMLPIMSMLIGALLAIPLASAIWIGRSRIAWLGVIGGALTVASLQLLGELLSGGQMGSSGTFVVVFVCFLAGALLTTLQTALWQRSGWRLIRIRRGAPGSAIVETTSEAASA